MGNLLEKKNECTKNLIQCFAVIAGTQTSHHIQHTQHYHSYPQYTHHTVVPIIQIHAFLGHSAFAFFFKYTNPVNKASLSRMINEQQDHLLSKYHRVPPSLPFLVGSTPGFSCAQNSFPLHNEAGNAPDQLFVSETLCLSVMSTDKQNRVGTVSSTGLALPCCNYQQVSSVPHPENAQPACQEMF